MRVIAEKQVMKDDLNKREKNIKNINQNICNSFLSSE